MIIKKSLIEMPPILLLFFYLNTLYLTRCDVSFPEPNLYNAGRNTTAEDVTETQHATCKIATEELVANAHATVTRVLTGACNAKTVNERFANLEKSLTKELNEIKALLRAILRCDGNITNFEEPCKNDENSIRNVPRTYKNAADNSIYPRQQEIDKLNGTIQEVSPSNDYPGCRKSLNYYWRIGNLDEKLERWNTSSSERSPTFHWPRSGYAMYMKVMPKHSPAGTVFIGFGLTRGRRDPFLRWPFPFKIRIEILDHSPEELRQDQRSLVWDWTKACALYVWDRPKLTGDPDNPECVGLSVPKYSLFSKLPSSIDQNLRNTRYLWNGSVTVKLTVYF